MKSIVQKFILFLFCFSINFFNGCGFNTLVEADFTARILLPISELKFEAVLLSDVLTPDDIRDLLFLAGVDPDTVYSIAEEQLYDFDWMNHFLTDLGYDIRSYDSFIKSELKKTVLEKLEKFSADFPDLGMVFDLTSFDSKQLDYDHLNFSIDDFLYNTEIGILLNYSFQYENILDADAGLARKLINGMVSAIRLNEIGLRTLLNSEDAAIDSDAYTHSLTTLSTYGQCASDQAPFRYIREASAFADRILQPMDGGGVSSSGTTLFNITGIQPDTCAIQSGRFSYVENLVPLLQPGTGGIRLRMGLQTLVPRQTIRVGGYLSLKIAGELSR